MTNTLKRLQEVDILFDQMIKSTEDHTTFRTNLNAFIQSARSTTWIMQKEFNHKPEFKEWYNSIQQQMKGDEIFGFFKELRNISVKEKSLGDQVIITTTFSGTFNGGKGPFFVPLGKVDERGNMVIDNEKKATQNGKPIDKAELHTSKHYFFEEKPEDDVIDLCFTYWQKLRNLIVECLNKFSTPK